MTSTALGAARQRIAAASAPTVIAGHLQARYGIEVSGLAGSTWASARLWVVSPMRRGGRVFPAAETSDDPERGQGECPVAV